VLAEVVETVTGATRLLSTPLRQAKPPAHWLVPVVGVRLNVVVRLVEEGLAKKAQVPPQMVAPFKAVVGAAERVNEVAVGVGVDNTLVFAASWPVPE
jgi:hypothetical protein